MTSGPAQQPRSEQADPPPSAATADTAEPPLEEREAEPSEPEAEPGAGTPEGTEAPTKDRRRGVISFLQELPVLLIIAFILALLIKTFLLQAFYIPSESMEPTLNVGDRVLVNKVVYHLHPPHRGDVIVFADPLPEIRPHRNPASAFWHWLTEGLGVATSPEKDFIKRVVGVPGDLIECKSGTVYVNGKPLNEPYVEVEDDRPCGPYTVPANSLFVMGDNRLNSRDSRYGLGFIPYDKVIGRAFVIIWPPSHVRWLHGP
jgi:signal peptidase I